MAYCVRCGVKLSEGSPSCPLCGTEVVLPSGMKESSQTPLFAQSLPPEGSRGLSKTKKGFIELLLSIFVISELSIFISMWFSGAIAHSFVPMFSIAFATLSLIYVILGRTRYTSQALVQGLLVSIYLLGLDLQNLQLSWSLPAILSIALYSALFVVPFTQWAKRSVTRTGLFMIFALIGYLGLINFVLNNMLTWFFPIAVPQLLIMLALGLLLLLWLTKRKNKKIPIADVVFGLLFVLFLSSAVFDLLLTHYQTGVFALRWAGSLVTASIIIFMFLAAVTVSRRLRRFFTSHNLHS